MEKIIINGGKTLSGSIQIGGAKNSVVALIPAALLAEGKTVISNVPNITDRDALFNIVKALGVKVSKEDTIVNIDSTNIKNVEISEELSKKLRASYYFMGVLLAKYKHVEMYFPGGCNIGARPIDLHLKGFEAMGVKVHHDEKTHKYTLDAKKLKGAKISLDFENAAKETEIINIADFLNALGADITGAGTSTIKINGVKKLHSASISVIPDRIEAGTYLIIGALLGDNLKVCGVNPDHITAVLNKFKDMCIDYLIYVNTITISKAKHFNPINITTLVYPGFPTDLGQPMSVLLTQADGTSYFEETIWENRMQHVEYLNKMGADIKLNDNAHAVINGATPLHGASINATDLRGGAALVVAGLVADGQTIISNIDYILRGYENLIIKLNNVGADIQIINVDE